MSALDGGVGNVIMNYFDHMPLEDYDVDIITQNADSQEYLNQYKKRGFHVKIVPSKSVSLIGNLKALYRLMKSRQYDIVHCHMTLTNMFPLMIAWLCGIKTRISHSHLASTYNLKTRILRFGSKLFATDYFACGTEAGRYLFGKSQFIVLNNAIDIDKYKIDLKIRCEERKKMGISENDVVIGHVGRFTAQKNHEYLLKIFKEIHNRDSNAKLVLIGTGELLEHTKTQVSAMHLDSAVIFTGVIDDVYRKLQIMDVFLLPSLCEGLCVAAIEAQATGVGCVFADTVALETQINTNVSFLSLKDSPEIWADKCFEICRKGNNSCDISLRNKGFDIKIEARKLDDFYKKKFMMRETD